MTSDKAEVFKYGLMAPSMKDGGRATKLMGKVDSFMLMETSMMANGLMIKHMDLASIVI